MNKALVKVVIGANYGDEGKGLATHYFSREASKMDMPCVNVLFNGGPQRGHTVELKDGTRHVFHHFGSGTFDGADTYFDRDFILNPMVFVKEKEELENLGYYGGRNYNVYVSESCRVTTPYDMFINQIMEISRGNSRHGSCGMGIWETDRRYFQKEYSKTYSEMARLNRTKLYNYLSSIREEYLPKTLAQYGIDEIPEEYQCLIEDEGIIEHYIDDFKKMVCSCVMLSDNAIAAFVDLGKYIVFEAGQGLLLDANNLDEYPNVTASSTGCSVPLKRLSDIDCDVEICYVTRSYLTRHGNGKLDSEVSKEEIGKNIEDRTNVPNEFQGTLRYAYLDEGSLFNRIYRDYFNVIGKKSASLSLMVTHMNERKTKMQDDMRIRKIYASDSKYAEDIIVREYKC